MSRRVRTALISAVVLLFLLLSVELARFLSVENVERDAVLGLLARETAGDAEGMLARLAACDASCRAVVVQDAATLRGNGELKILNTASATAYSLTGGTGKTRVAWKQGRRLPVVQCVLVRRGGDVVGGISVKVLSIGAPIAGTADCP
ncbi:MAG: hypothetical protein ACR2ND_09410 [Solirubrobacteraceae bacterium]